MSAKRSRRWDVGYSVLYCGGCGASSVRRKKSAVRQDVSPFCVEKLPRKWKCLVDWLAVISLANMVRSRIGESAQLYIL